MFVILVLILYDYGESTLPAWVFASMSSCNSERLTELVSEVAAYEVVRDY